MVAGTLRGTWWPVLQEFLGVSLDDDGTLKQSVVDEVRDGLALQVDLDAAEADIVAAEQDIADINDYLDDGVVSPLRYGAVGDGVTDDTAALQAFLDTQLPQSGSDVYNAGGKVLDGMGRTYRITAPLTIDDVWFFTLRNFNFLVAAPVADVLLLRGVSYGLFQNIFIQAVGNWAGGNTADYAVRLESNQGVTVPAGVSTGNVFYNVRVIDVKTKVAFAFGVNSAGYQVDLVRLFACEASGQYDVDSPDATWYQAGFRFGSGTAGNILAHQAYGCMAYRFKYGADVQSVDVTWIGGVINFSEVDFNHNGSQPLYVGHLRSETSRRFLQTASGTSWAPGITVQSVTFNCNELNADTYWILHRTRGSLKLYDIQIADVGSGVDPKVRMDHAEGGFLEIHGMVNYAPIEQCYSKTDPNSGVIYGYTERSQVDDSVVAQWAGPVYIGETKIQALVTTNAPDMELYRNTTLGHWYVNRRFVAKEGFDSRPDGTASEKVFRGYIPNSTEPTIAIQADGKLLWAAESLASDTSLERKYASTLGMSSGDSFATKLYDVRNYGGRGDGTTDNKSVIQSMRDTIATAGNGELYLPAGTYHTTADVVLVAGTTTRLTIRGDGPQHTIMRPNSSITNAFLGGFSNYARELVIEGIGFDLTNVSGDMLNFTGAQVDRITIRNCHFYNFSNESNRAIAFDRASNILVEDCHFWGAGGAIGKAIQLEVGIANVVVRRCEFRWLRDGIIGDTGSTTEATMSRVTIEDCYFDAGWWLIKQQGVHGNSGGTVTYTGTVLTDSAAAFSGFSTGANTNVRIMPVRHTENLTASSSRQITMSGATFVADGVLRGEIIRTASAWAIVEEVESETALRIEGWLDLTTYEPVAPPANGTSATIYGIYLGEVTSFTGTTITTPRFWDLNGATVTPAAGDRYEVLVTRPNYHINIEGGAKDVRIHDNVVRRGWADQVSVFCPRASIRGNTIEDGQDMGITVESASGWSLHTGHSIVAENHIHHQGAGGIAIHGADIIVSDNVITATQWENFVETEKLGAIWLSAASRCRVHHNMIDGWSKPLAAHGITLTDTCADNWIESNSCRRHSGADLNIVGTNVTGTHVRDLEGTMGHPSSATGQDYHLRGAGTPEGAATAGLGSLFMRTDGSTSTTLYVKTSGTGNTGWTAK
jgi:hypothetical protein